MIDSQDIWKPAQANLALPAGDIHVWRVTTEAAQPACLHEHILSPDEKDRATRFARVADRARFTRVRAALRVILGGYAGVAPADIRFAQGPSGKPALPPGPAGASDLSFSVSHSADLGVIAVGRLPDQIGVDTERIEPVPEAPALARRFFAPAEADAVAAAEGAMRERVFYAIWTRKEAVVKALGAGIGFGLARFTVTTDPAGPASLVSIDGGEAGLWTLRDIPAGAGYAAALAVKGSVRRVELFGFGWV